MAAQVKKISPSIESTPEMLLGMLKGDVSRMKSICAVIIWDDDSFQCVHSAMPLSQLSYGVHLFQLALFEDMQNKSQE